MTRRASLAVLLHQLDNRSPAGFAIALHIRFTTPKYMFQTYAQRWMQHYSSSGLVLHDPVARWGLQNVGHVRWSDLEAIDNKGVMEQAKDFGLMNGVAISVLVSGTRSIGGFARADREFEEHEVAELEDLLEQLHRATADLGQLSAGDEQALTELAIKLTH